MRKYILESNLIKGNKHCIINEYINAQLVSSKDFGTSICEAWDFCKMLKLMGETVEDKFIRFEISNQFITNQCINFSTSKNKTVTIQEGSHCTIHEIYDKVCCECNHFNCDNCITYKLSIEGIKDEWRITPKELDNLITINKLLVVK